MKWRRIQLTDKQVEQGNIERQPDVILINGSDINKKN